MWRMTALLATMSLWQITPLIGGYVTVADYAILGGLVGVHQFARIGSTVLWAGSLVTEDVVCSAWSPAIAPCWAG